ncbi:hypothetical protein CAPTEDRAFT_197333 [Capitella teleta]|uniref:Histone deacetylase domain-containing protein n=1 Tax=Capitella teleta TaxID=283909 RepID=R7TQ16_CAPTE|nr:hypothetical protein CAPTEDRAFT_197333 [Capitella teleta]|eukprot:ELT95657.1 hypothetical protein CAPTEDRAFT_197333 [Capitella teleta]
MAEGVEGSNSSPPHRTELYFDIQETQWPIVYSPEYNIAFLGLEKLHPFDSGKWGRVYEFLKEAKMIYDYTIVKPKEAQTIDLLVVHSMRYISTLRWSMNVASITEVPPVALVPNFIVQKKVLRPFRYQTGGTILIPDPTCSIVKYVIGFFVYTLVSMEIDQEVELTAAKLAVERGWSINIGGGFHHCCAEKGGGFCAYADITLAIRFLLQRTSTISKVMIVDLDAHQGNGHARDFMDEDGVYILDIYNRQIYPRDGFAKRGIRRKVELEAFTEDEEYLRKVRNNVEGALNEFEPDLVVYNAGTDVLEGDPLGLLSITPQGIIERDQIVFQKVRTRGIPIVMVTSGGYQPTTARIIADSILNLRALSLIRYLFATQRK